MLSAINYIWHVILSVKKNKLKGGKMADIEKTKKTNKKVKKAIDTQKNLQESPTSYNLENKTNLERLPSSQNKKPKSKKAKEKDLYEIKLAKPKANKTKSLDPPTTTKLTLKEKIAKIKEPRLIKLVFKRNKLRKLRKNYGANFASINRYLINLKEAEKYANNLNKLNEQEVEQHVSRKNKSKKKKALNFLYFFLNVAVIVVILSVQLSQESNPLESLSSILNVNPWFLLAAFGMFALCIFADQMRHAILIHKATGTFRLRLSYKLTAVGRYYDVITPLSVGGQPFQVFYAKRYGINAGEGISIETAKYIFNQIIYFICVTYVLISNIYNNTVSTFLSGSVSVGIVSTLVWIGYSITAVVLFTIIFISLNKRVGTSIVAGILKLVGKFRIGKIRLINNYNKAFIKTMKTVNSWQSTTKKYSKSFFVILICCLCSLIYFVAQYSLPFFIYCAFEGFDINIWFTIVTIAVMVDLTSAFNPIPMGVGTADLSFTVLYGALFGLAGIQVWALIIWRILNYYIYIIQGLFVITYDYAIGNRRLNKYKEIWMLPIGERRKKLKELKMQKKNSDQNLNNNN